MVVYADILIILNLTVDYMLIAVTGKILRLKPPLIRQTAAGRGRRHILAVHICAEYGCICRPSCKK